MKQISIYTDGACAGNQHDNNVGGWGCILEYRGHRKELHGGEVNTTNNRMELLALIAAFEALKEQGLGIRVFSDSAYLVNCFKKKWYENWQRNGWKTSSRKPVENQDLWKRLIAETEKHHVSLFRIQGHLNLGASDEVIDRAYRAFLKENGAFTREEFLYIAAQNIRADELANCFIRAHRAGEASEKETPAREAEASAEATLASEMEISEEENPASEADER